MFGCQKAVQGHSGNTRQGWLTKDGERTPRSSMKLRLTSSGRRISLILVTRSERGSFGRTKVNSFVEDIAKRLKRRYRIKLLTLIVASA